MHKQLKMNDKIVESVVNQMIKRSEIGFIKYGKTLERDDYTPLDWIVEAQQEAMDLALYLERIKQDLLSLAGDIDVAHKNKANENTKGYTPRI
jgi:hypothetical protein